MPRNLTYSALTLRVKASGESNREAWFLTSEEGIIKATVFGGPKSRLRAQVAPFHEGKLWIYHDPVRDSRKVTDFDVHSYRTGLRELYDRIMTATGLAETILAFHGGGGNWPEAFRLSGSVLDVLETADEAVSTRLGLYFMWHWAGILGLRDGLLVDSDSRQEGKAADSPLDLGPGATQWLKAIESLPAVGVKRVSMDNSSLQELRIFTQTMLGEALGQKLLLWN